MVRLNADLIWKSPHFFNAIKERELDLRGNKIAIIENIGATEDQFDTIDLSDNDIVMLENFHFMNCFGTLLINSNRITYINHNLGEFLHKMHTLVLTNNCLTSLAEIDPLVSLPKLQFLSLLDNTVTKQPDYLLYVIHKLKHLRLLDFKEVKQQEKTEAARKFHSKETDEAEKRIATKSYTPGHVVDSEGTTKNQGAKVISPTPAQITAIKEFLEADLDSIYDTLSHIESYIYQNFERAPFNFILSWRKRLFHGMHILPPPRRQESDDCAYHATLALMECGFKVMYANRLVGTQEFNIKLSHKHLNQLVHDYVSSKEGKGFNPRDLLLVCLRMAMRHGVISEEDYDMGRLREAIRYHILSYTELSADEIRDIPGMLFDDAKMVLTSFRVTPRYRALLPHEIYRYVPSEDPACQPWTGDKKPSHVSHCVVLTGPGLAYRAPEDCETEAELSTPERYFEYLNSYSSGYGVDGCGFIFADSIRNCYTVDV